MSVTYRSEDADRDDADATLLLPLPPFAVHAERACHSDRRLVSERKEEDVGTESQDPSEF